MYCRLYYVDGRCVRQALHKLDWNLNVKGQFSSEALEAAIKSLVPASEDPEKALLNDGHSDQRPCRAYTIPPLVYKDGGLTVFSFVCAIRESNKSVVRFRSYDCDAPMVVEGVSIWQAARATSAATSFFDPVVIGQGYLGQRYVDGALGRNNPLDEVWTEAQDIWETKQDSLEVKLKCIVSIGTGNLGTSAVGNKPWTILNALKDIATETEDTEHLFASKHRTLLEDEQRYFRFNVDQGLQAIGLEEYKRQGDIAAATARYLEYQLVRNQVRTCAINLSHKECMSIEGLS